tara:strand:- start:12791 stop:12955 length:165 start_codon:yes stop_codon:yes gene_type:complete
MLTKDALKGALKTVNRLYDSAIANNNKIMIRTWESERNRIINLLTTLSGKNNNV